MRFECSHCHGILEIADCEPGEAVACGHCGSAVAVPDSQLAPGAVVGDFELREELGRGGMGTVYLAHQISLDRDAAVKVLHQEFAEDQQYTESFVREARAAANLNHPSIVQAYAVGQDDGLHYFAMEYVSGSTLKQVLVHSGRMVPERALSIITKVAEALDFGWTNQKLVHRDIKPDNIMLTSGGTVKLADLGLARLGSEKAEASGEVHGTPQYISPEQLLGQRAQTQADIYSLGATFYHMLSGKFPYVGDSAVAVAEKHLLEPLTPLTESTPDVPPALGQIVEGMMAKRPGHRYRDAAELLEDLVRVGRGEMPKHEVPADAQKPVDMEVGLGVDGEEDEASPEAPQAPGKVARRGKSLRLGGSSGALKIKSGSGSAVLKERVGADEAPDAVEADEDLGEDEGEAEAAALAEPKGRKLMPLVLVLVLLLALGGGAAYYFLVMVPASSSETAGTQGEADKRTDELAHIRKLKTDNAATADVAAALTEFAQSRKLGTMGTDFWELAGPLVEEDLQAARSEGQKAQLAAWGEARAKLVAEAEARRLEEEDRVRKQAEQQAKDDEARRKNEEKAAAAAELVAEKDKLRWAAVKLCRANDYISAEAVFAVMARSKQADAAAWAVSKQECTALARKLYERIYNSKKALAGAKLPGPTPKRKWTVTFIGPKAIEAEMLVKGYEKGKPTEETKHLKIKLADADGRVVFHLLGHLLTVDKALTEEDLNREFGAFLVSRARYLSQAKERLANLSGTKAMLAEIEILAKTEAK